MPPRKRKRSKSAPAAMINTNSRSGKRRRKWDDLSMTAALEAAKSGNMSINKAALLHGVPPTTLKDRLSGKVIHGSKPGPKPYLSAKEECDLADHLIQSAKIGYGRTRKEVKSIVEKVAREKELFRGSNSVSDGWWWNFKKRQPSLSLRRGDSTAHVRMDCTNKETIEQYYNLLEDTLRKHELLNNPEQIYNMDESGMPLDPRPPNVVAKRGMKKVRYRVSGKKEQITIIACANALGQCLPPMVIFEGKYLNHQWTLGEVPGTYYGMSDKGWTDQELFRHWLKNHFVRYAVPGRPILLLLDGHSSHYEPASVEFANEENIILFCLPPHTTQDTQPLDCTVFGPLKRHWSSVCHQQQLRNPGMIISKLNFSKVFAEAWLKALTPVNIVAGFKKCGIYPFNRNAIPFSNEGSGEDEPTISLSPSGTLDQSLNINSSTTPSGTLDLSLNSNSSTTPSGTLDLSLNSNSTASYEFTNSQLIRFQRRFEEGFDVYNDEHYVAWLRLNHPEAAPSDRSDEPMSFLNEFASVSPLDPIPLSNHVSSLQPTRLSFELTPKVTNYEPLSSPVSQSCSPPGTSLTPSSSSAVDVIVSDSDIIPPDLITTETVTNSLHLTPSQKSQVPSTPLQNSQDSTTKVSPLTKYLQLPNTSKTKPPVASSKNRAITGARVLTSAECLAIIKDKEMKKKLEQEEKERKKKEREEKKKQKQEDIAKKAEERAKRNELRARKAEEKTRKELEKKRKRAKSTECQEDGGSAHNVVQPKKSTRICTNPKRARLQDDDISGDKCCVCFQDFEEDVELGIGIEWVQCACTRWLHEDCILDCITEISGKERFCPYCT